MTESDLTVRIDDEHIMVEAPDRNRLLHATPAEDGGGWELVSGPIEGLQYLEPVDDADSREQALEQVLRWIDGGGDE